MTQQFKKAAFSLVEMLMALLVASLLMAALAPVMTKRMDEAKLNISGVGAAQYDKDAVIQIFNVDGTFLVPVDVNSAKVTMLGGGGAGGDAFHGVKEFKDPSSIQSWKVPEGVTKLRVYMVGGGGGGASGGVGVGTAYADIPAVTANETCKDFKTAGETKFTIPNNASWKVPALDEACKASGVTQWTLTSDSTTKYTPGATAGAELKVTACGGGGGGGAYGSTTGGGGSGGYITNVSITSPVSTIYVKVGGGGGGGQAYQASSNAKGGYAAGGGGGGAGTGGENITGGSAGTYGGNGGKGGSTGSNTIASSGSNGTGISLSYGGTSSQPASGYYSGSGGRGGIWGGGGGGGAQACDSAFTNDTGANGGGGGGGGGPTTISTTSGISGTIIFQIGGGGGGGAGQGASGGGGGGYGGGGGGGGVGKYSTSSYGTGATSLSASIGIGNGQSGKSPSGSLLRGGGGGGGYGGASGAAAGSATAGKISTIFGSNYCNGGNGVENAFGTTPGTQGKPGALRLCYGTSQKRENALKCTYNMPANGGGGGGAGQMTIGEIDVVPGETLYFEVGAGGGNQAVAGKNGNNGKATYIRRGSSTGTIIATALGGNAGEYSSDANVASAGGARLTTRVFTMINNVANNNGNWLNKTFTGGYGGGNGVLASALTNKGFGGAGGNIQNMKGESVQGGVGGNSVKNGASPAIDSYGAGGGGGAGAQSAGDTFGIGAAGASGYIYIEYGGSNGGGGTSGEYISKTLYNLKPGSEIPITIGKGGKTGTAADGTVYDGMGEETSFGTLLKARGGLKGISGLVKDEHGGIKKLPDTYSNYTADEGASVHGHAGSEIGGGIGGNMEYIYQNIDNTYATFIKSKDGKIAGPPLGGCGGNMSSAGNCNAAASGAQGKVGVFGGGGGGGAVVDGVGGLGGYGGNGVVIIEYKSTSM